MTAETSPLALRRTITTASLVFVMYFTVSGGPFSLEGLVASVGPGFAILMLLVIPIVWSLPEVLIVGELASMLPEEGGYYRWVRRAFGPFWAFQNGWYTWLYSLVDMAIYPVLFNQYLKWVIPGISPGESWIVSLVVIWGATFINLRGAFRVGRVSVWIGLFVVTGFTLLAVVAIPRMHGIPWHPFTKPGQTPTAALGVALSTVLWNYLGWDNASTVEGEIVDPGRAYPKALAIALPLVTLGYFIPLLPALGATNWTTWHEGGWPAIARVAAGPLGPFLANWIAVAGMLSALALFNALLLAYSRIPLAMAADGFLPAAFARTDGNGTPRNAVLVSAVCYSLFALAPFGQLVVADVLLYALALFLEYGALVRLRRAEPDLRGPFRIPVGTGGVIALIVLPSVVMLATVGVSLVDGEFGLPAVVGSLVAAALGPVAYWLARRNIPQAPTAS